MQDPYKDFFENLTEEEEEKILDFTSDMYLFHEVDKQYMKEFFIDLEENLKDMLKHIKEVQVYLENGVKVVANIKDAKKYVIELIEQMVIMTDFAALNSIKLLEEDDGAKQTKIVYAMTSCVFRKYGKDFWDEFKDIMFISVDSVVSVAHNKFNEYLGWAINNIKRKYPDFMDKTIEMKS